PRAAPAARAAAGNDRAGVPVGRVLALGNGRDDPEALLYVPRDSGAAPALAVLVHGITRNAFEHVSAFRELAERRGVVLLAPLFLPERDRGYQRLASGIDGVAADIKLLRLVDRVAELVGAATERVFLFGFSGGAQFVHRFALRHPERVARLAVASAGWYTLPDEQLAFPLGLRGAGARLDEFLRLPQRVFVGDADVASDAGLNRTPEIEAAQGRTRVARAEHWVAALRAAAIERGLEPSVTLELLAGVGHSFADNARIGALARRTFDFFFATASQTVNR
ncbi:MAG: hypothetical protein KDE27_12175, partial [Planctomycetes bacterium]|nr:hypothetical protein [Planctomycetota bacterium]